MRAFSLLAALSLSTLAVTARANPADSFGLGSRSTSLGGAVSASVSDFSACYYNPSGLAFAPGTELAVGYMAVAHQLSINGHDSQIDPVRGLVGGIVAPGAILDVPFAFGIATHLSDDRISRARTIRQDEPRWVLYDNRSQLLYLSADLAIRPVKWLSFGGGVTFLAATRGAFSVRGTAVLPLAGGSQYDSQLRHEVDADLTAVRYGQFGVTIKPDDDWSFALVHRMSAQISLEIGADLRGTVDASLLRVPATYLLDSRTTNAYLPARWVLGTSRKLGEHFSVELDLEYVRWSGYQSPVSRSTTVIDVDVPGGLVEIPPSPKPSKVIDPGFSDTLVPRVGAEYRLEVGQKWELPVRAGYAYERSPVPDQTGITNLVDADRHVLALGIGVAWKKPGAALPGTLRLDTHAQYSWLPERITQKPNPADFVGDYRAGGHIVNLGATLGVDFE